VTFQRLWGFLAVGLPVLAALAATMSTVDLAYQLRAGAEILDARAIPSQDTWTFTVPGTAWFDQQWAAQVALRTVYDVGAWFALAAFRATLVGVVFGSAYAVARGEGLPARTAALLTLGSFAIAAPALALRPQLIALALFALVLWLLARRVQHPRSIWLIPLLVVLWANVHGSFFLGPLAVALTLLADRHRNADRDLVRREAIVAVLSLLATFINPFGPAVWRYAVGLSTNGSVTERISEWQRTSIFDVAGLLFYASVVAVGALVILRRRHVDWPMLLWLVAFAAIGAYAVRGIAWWAIAVLPIVARLLAAPELAPGRAGTPGLRRANAAVAGLLAVVGFVLLVRWIPTDPATGTPPALVTDAPSSVTAAMRGAAAQGDHVFNPQPWGSWFEFSLPQVLVAVDSRVELFPPEIWAAYDAVRGGRPGWEAILARWDVRFVAVEPDASAFVDRLTAAGWRVVSADKSGTVLEAPG
jgi:hypothetical protein